MKNKEKFLLGLSCFFGGMVAGFFIAPIKKGIYCGNNSGNNSGNNYGNNIPNEETLGKIIDNDKEDEEKNKN